MTLERLQEIFDGDNGLYLSSTTKEDRVLLGLQLLATRLPNQTLIEGVGHDIIWSLDEEKAAKILTEEDAKQLHVWGWHIDSDSSCLAKFV